MGQSDSESGYDSDVDFRGRHKCTDIPCMVVFLATMVGLCALVKHADTTGNMKQLYYGVDKSGNICGVSDDVKEKPYLYWCQHLVANGSNVVSQVDFTNPQCVASCPSDDSTLAPTECHLADGADPLPYKVISVQGHSCIPAPGEAADNSIDMVSSHIQKLAADEMGIRHGKQVLAVAVLSGLLAGYGFLYMLRKTAKCLIYFFTAMTALLMVLLGSLIWSLPPSDMASQMGSQRGNSGALGSRHFMAMVFWALSVLIVVVFWCYRKAINTSLACIQCAVLVMFKMPCLLLAPFKLALVKVILWLSMLYGLFHMVALLEWRGTPNGTGFERELVPDSPMTSTVGAYMVFGVFAMIWALEFVNAVYFFTISYATSCYYFTEPDEADNRSVHCMVLQEGAFVAIFKHTGSLAYGSLIVTIVSTFFWGLAYLDRQAKTGCNPIVVCIARCLMCCCKCVEGIVGFVNKNCYTEMAITGSHGFCASIKNVMNVMVDQGAAMVIMNAATFIIQCQGLQVIVGTSVLVSLGMLSKEKYSSPLSESHVESPGLLIAMVAILSATVGWSFMSVFDAVTDALLFCFALDKMQNDGCVTTAPKDFLALYNVAEEKVHRKNKKQDKKNKRAEKKSEAAAEPLVAGGRPECKMGCGRLAAPGRARNGTFYDTCCRGCATGGDHDDGCQA